MSSSSKRSSFMALRILIQFPNEVTDQIMYSELGAKTCNGTEQVFQLIVNMDKLVLFNRFHSMHSYVHSTYIEVKHGRFNAYILKLNDASLVQETFFFNGLNSL